MKTFFMKQIYFFQKINSNHVGRGDLFNLFKKRS